MTVISRSSELVARRRDETGSTLILALVLLLVGTLVVGGLSYMVTSDLTNSGNFASTRSIQYAASSTTNLAIQNIRYTPLLSPAQTLNASPPGYCWGSSAPSQLTNINGVAGMTAWCSTAWDPTSASTRVVTISTCLSTVTQAASCEANPLLQAVVTFDDYPAGVTSPTTAACYVYCGTSMAISSWVWKPRVPTVTAISATSGPVTGGTSFNLTGTGFTSGTKVTFIRESGGVPTADNLTALATSVTRNSSTSISAIAPAVTSASAYFVVVTTQDGTSAHNSSAIFSYAAVIPTVTAISPSTGGTPGGTAVTITGTGFTTGATVSFVPTGGGSTLSATSVTINGPTNIVAVSPAVTAAATYYVEVTTPGGISAGNSASTYTYATLVPTVFSVTVTSGANIGGSSGGYNGGTGISLAGTGFVTGDKVCLVKASQASPGSTSCPSQATINTLAAGVITATTPSVGSSNTGLYYVFVIDSSNNPSSLYPTFTYLNSTAP